MQNFRSEVFPDPGPGDSRLSGGGLRRFLLDMVETIVLAFLLFVAINSVSARIRVESISMQPTLYAGDFIIVNKIAYKLGTPGRGDVIIFHYPPNPQIEPYIKRVIGLPGETVTISKGKVHINGVPLEEGYIQSPPNYEGTWQVPPDSLFVLGDNRNNSSDSHAWGMVPFSNVIGKAEVVYWPPSQWRVLNQSTAAAAAP